MTTEPEHMFSCDQPDCDVTYPAFEPLRGLEELAIAAGEAIIEEDGWYVVRSEDTHYCPDHVEYGRKEWAL